MEKEKSELEERSHSARIQQGKRQSGNRCSHDKAVRCVHGDSMEEREKRIMALMGRARIMAFPLKDFVPRTLMSSDGTPIFFYSLYIWLRFPHI